MATEQAIKQALSTIIDPDFNKDIVSLGFVKDIHIEGRRASVTIELTTPACPVKESFRQQAEQAILALDDIDSVDVKMTSRTSTPRREGIPGIANIIAVASGKGGVGKSTTTVNLAVAMARTGARVGLLDADIYGPSIPRMMHLADLRPQVRNKRLQPLQNYGVKTISIGFLVDENQAAIWRGPMVSGAVMQLLKDVDWGELDYLFIDLPPGTGDIHLTLAQNVPMSGAVVVTTPQDIALLDARRGIAMFDKVHIPTLGLVENMSVFICPHCGESSHIFAKDGADKLSAQTEVPLLAKIPLDIRIRQDADAGTPVVVSAPDSEPARLYLDLAGKVARRVSVLNQRKVDIPVTDG
ncbi:MAG: iron-sulfur cluster carrier protein ApbC [Zetaproteobacteria bacterium]|nr:MAG: iron-sulfur cluster carrier protein ApbC [Zetaproteobacteria bacterium]